MRVKKQKLKNYVVNGIVHNNLEQNELLRLVNLLPDEPHLDEDQQQVLDWLQWSFEDQGNSSIDAIYLLRLGEAIDSVSLSYMTLTKKDQTEVLAVFSQWALEQEEE
ncbi:hypothetical protein [Enterococcus gallinarum]|uniref:hypothetical protein n=1 Tax=Enterococcus gallinarum TaxID=1353 RepID=UPI00214ADC0A|nr:hypothetical protein [Enterococcus gallinarum]MCR1930890.1 hypothetical protein [Enterococcus gallinarum]